MTAPRCPHGDPTCPCQDDTSSACHYEGVDAMPCPSGMPVSAAGDHCHVEGCRWDVEGCGLSRMGFTTHDDPKPGDEPSWSCGAQRASDVLWNMDDAWWKTKVGGEP